MTPMQTNEQWTSGGDCTQCRRNKYCSKPCTANKRFEKERLSQAVTETVVGTLGHAGVSVNTDVIRTVSKIAVATQKFF